MQKAQKVDFGSSVDPAMYAAFLARGGTVSKVPTDTARSYTNQEWKALVRGEELDVVDVEMGFVPSKGFIKLGTRQGVGK